MDRVLDRRHRLPGGRGRPDDHGPIHGRDALRVYAHDWLDTFDDFRQDPVEQIDAGGDKVIVVFRISGRAKVSGVETDLTYAALYTFRDGKIARGREYWTRAEALEAAGLSEQVDYRFGRNQD